MLVSSASDVSIGHRFGRVVEISPCAEEAIGALQARVAAWLISSTQRDTGLHRQRRLRCAIWHSGRAQGLVCDLLVCDDERELAAMRARNDHEIKFQMLEVDRSVGSEVNRSVPGAVGVYAIRSGAGMSDCGRAAPGEGVPSGKAPGAVEGC
jgi:hypothetical protein